MATDWNRVRELENVIAGIGYGTSTDPTEIARFNAAQRELASLTGGGGSGGGANGWLDDAISESRSRAGAAVGSAQNGVQAILGGRPAVDRAVGDMRDAANAMLPIADTMRGEGDALFDSGTKVTEQALATLDTGLGFINMDSSSSPLVAQAVKQFGEFDPDRYVASAAQDAQSQGDAARRQGERNLARMGVSPTSGAALALDKLYDKGLAVARAAAMTRARERGKNDQMTAFQNLLANNANTFLQTGGQLASIGTSARAQGVGAQQGAAGVLGNAGNLFGNAGELGLNYDKSLMSAYNALAGVQSDAAWTALSGGKLRVSASRGGGPLVSTDTGRHYGVGGELLETGDARTDADLQRWRDTNNLY